MAALSRDGIMDVYRHPWESMARRLATVKMTDLYGGFAYISTGRRDPT